MLQRYAGVVKWYNKTKGYGFIGHPDGDDVFVHSSALTGQEMRWLQKGERVEFSIEQNAKGLQANQVIRL